MKNTCVKCFVDKKKGIYQLPTIEEYNNKEEIAQKISFMNSVLIKKILNSLFEDRKMVLFIDI